MDLTGKHLLICEEALTDFNGHFFTWIKAIRTLHLAAGAKVTVAANRNVIPEIQSEIGAIPTYTHNSWAQIYHHENPLRRYAGVFLHNWRVYVETSRLLKQVGPVDMVLLPASRIHHLLAWRLLCARQLGNKFQRLLFFILTSEAIYDAEYKNFHFKKSSALIKAVLRSFSGLASSGKVIPAGDSHVTCGEYTALSGLPFSVLPSPSAGLNTVHQPSTEPRRPADVPPCFTILGVSVIDKGIDVLQDAILLLLERRPDLKARFVIHWATPTVNYDGSPVPIKDQLRNAPQVTLLERTLSEQEYRDYLLESDFVVLPYRRRVYFNRLSGVVIEAACAGIPMIVTENTWLDWAMREYGAGVSAKDGDATDLAGQILYCLDHFEELQRAARDKQPVAMEKNSTDRYLASVWEKRAEPAQH